MIIVPRSAWRERLASTGKWPSWRQRLLKGGCASSQSTPCLPRQAPVLCGRCTRRVKEDDFCVQLHTRDILQHWKCPKLASSDYQDLEMWLA